MEMSKPKKAPKAKRVNNQAFGRKQPVEFRDVVQKLLETPPAKKASWK
jgi:hypothetical protein